MAAQDEYAFHTITVEIHESRKSLPFAVRRLMQYVEAFPAKIFDDPSLGSNVSTVGDISYSMEARDLGGVDTLALIFNIEGVKILSTE